MSWVESITGRMFYKINPYVRDWGRSRTLIGVVAGHRDIDLTASGSKLAEVSKINQYVHEMDTY